MAHFHASPKGVKTAQRLRKGLADLGLNAEQPSDDDLRKVTHLLGDDILQGAKEKAASLAWNVEELLVATAKVILDADARDRKRFTT